MNKKVIDNIHVDTFRDKAFGAMIGSFIGDTIGASINSGNQLPSSQEVARSLQMVGGGPKNLGPGQVSDQSELAMALVWGLIEANQGIDLNEERKMDMDIIANQY